MSTSIKYPDVVGESIMGLDDQEEFVIPERYEMVVRFYKNKGEFPYLRFNGSNFTLAPEKVRPFFLDLRSKLPGGLLMKKGIVMLGSAFSSWKSTLSVDRIPGIGPDMSLDMDDIKTILIDDNIEMMKEVDWEKVTKIFLVVLFILFILGILIGIAVATDGDVPFDGTLLQGIGPINIGGRKKEEGSNSFREWKFQS